MIRRVPREHLRSAPTPLVSGCQLASEETRAPSPQPAWHAIERALRLLLDEELTIQPSHIQAVVERELKRVHRARTIALHVHPADAALLARDHEYQDQLELQGTLETVLDPAISRGGCRVVSDLGEVDATLETRLDAALTLLRRGAFDER